MHWLVYASIIIVSSSAFHVFSKFAENKIDPSVAVLFVQGAGFLASIALFFLFNHGTGKEMNIQTSGIIFAIISGTVISFSNFAVFAMYNAGAPMSIAVPLTRTAVVICSVIFGILLFRENIDLTRSIGILLGIASIYCMVKK